MALARFPNCMEEDHEQHLRLNLAFSCLRLNRESLVTIKHINDEVQYPFRIIKHQMETS